MADIYKLQMQFQQNQNEMIALRNGVMTLETRYDVLTDQYMNGNIPYDIGKDQARIKREINKLKRRYEKLSEQNRKIQLKLQKQ